MLRRSRARPASAAHRIASDASWQSRNYQITIAPKSIRVLLDKRNPTQAGGVIRFAGWPTVFAAERKIHHT
jgi:hypothetical protein